MPDERIGRTGAGEQNRGVTVRDSDACRERLYHASSVFLKPLDSFTDPRVVPLLCAVRSPSIVRCYGVTVPGGVAGSGRPDRIDLSGLRCQEQSTLSGLRCQGQHGLFGGAEASGPAFDLRCRTEMMTALRVDPPPPVRSVVFECLYGKTLAEIPPGTLSPAVLERWFDRLIRGLAWLSYAAGRPVVHGDISPKNIMILPDGSPVLVDFASARLPGGSGPEPPTRTSCTPGYAAPEIFRADPRPESDLYSLAVTLLAVFSGCSVKALSGGKREEILSSFARPFADRLRGCLSADPGTRRRAAAQNRMFPFYDGPDRASAAVSVSSELDVIRCPYQARSCPFLKAASDVFTGRRETGQCVNA